MKFKTVLFRRGFDFLTSEGELTSCAQNDYIFDNIAEGKPKEILDSLLTNPKHIPSRGKKKAIVGVITDEDEIYSVADIQDYLKSYGIMQIEHVSNKRILIQNVDRGLILSNIDGVFKAHLYDFIDTFVKDSKVTKFLYSKTRLLCIDKSGEKSYKHLVLKAEMPRQIIKEEYIDVFGESPDQME